jgi:hypothetical protein
LRDLSNVKIWPVFGTQGRWLNIYQKAKFADSFKSTLLANGLDTAIAGAVTRRLVRHLSLKPESATQRESHQALLTRADQLFNDGLLADAIECYQRFVEHHPPTAQVLNNLGSALYIKKAPNGCSGLASVKACVRVAPA